MDKRWGEEEVRGGGVPSCNQITSLKYSSFTTHPTPAGNQAGEKWSRARREGTSRPKRISIREDLPFPKQRRHRPLIASLARIIRYASVPAFACALRSTTPTASGSPLMDKRWGEEEVRGGGVPSCNQITSLKYSSLTTHPTPAGNQAGEKWSRARREGTARPKRISIREDLPFPKQRRHRPLIASRKPGWGEVVES